MDTQDLSLPVNHQEIMTRFIAACQADDRIVAAALGGSYAEGKTDQYSDLDLFFITTDEAYENFITTRERFIRLLGEPLFYEGFGQPNGYNIIYSNGAEAEVYFYPESKLQGINWGFIRILLDKKGILTGVIFPKPAADLSIQVTVLRQQIDWFWHDLSHFIKAMARGQLWFAYGELEFIRRICVNLARFNYNFSDPYLGEEPYFKVDEILPNEQLLPLMETCCPLEYNAMLQAGTAIFRYYQAVVPTLARAHSIPYPVDLERMMLARLEELGDAKLR